MVQKCQGVGTYGEEGDIAVGSVDGHSQLPGVPVTEASNHSLEGLGSSDEDGSAEDSYREDVAGDEVGDEIDACEESWVKRGAKLVLPFLF